MDTVGISFAREKPSERYYLKYAGIHTWCCYLKVFLKLVAIFRLCMEHDISFDAIDLQYAYPDTSSSVFPALSILEMKSCISEANVGIRHIGLIGNSVGICPLPLQIGRVEYASVVERLESEEEKELVNFWYEKEEGSVPVRYKLQQPLYASPIVQGGADLDDLRFVHPSLIEKMKGILVIFNV